MKRIFHSMLRERPLAMGRVRDVVRVAELPRQAGAATVLRLHGGKVHTVEYAHYDGQRPSVPGLESSQKAGAL